MPSQILPISNRSPSPTASAATLVLKDHIDADPSASLIISSQFDNEKAISIHPLLPGASTYNSTANIITNHQQRRRRSNSDTSLALLAHDSPRHQSLTEEVGHAAAETFLITRLSLKLLRYLGYHTFSSLFSFFIALLICLHRTTVVLVAS